MKAENTFSIDFVTRKAPAHPGFHSLYARVTVNGDSREISLKQLVRPREWDSRGECLTPKAPEAQSANEYIRSVRYLITKKYRLLIDKEEVVTAERVKQEYLGNQVVQTPKEKTDRTVLLLFQQHNENNGIDPKTGKKGLLTQGSMKNYHTTLKYLKLYHTFINREDTSFLELDYEFLEGFEFYIRNHAIKDHDPCKGNGVYKHMERLHKIVLLAKKRKWLRDDPFEDYEMHKTKPRRKKLDIDDLIKIESQKFYDPKIAYVQELFLFSCYTGLAYIDVMGLTPSDFVRNNDGELWLNRYRQKSAELSPVPLFRSALKILNRYWTPDKGMNDKIFPYVSNQEANRNVKIIRATCGIFKEMTFHLARHTFATTVTLKNGVPMETVSKMLGHMKLSTTQIYAEVDEEKIAGDMEGVEDRLNERMAKRLNVLKKKGKQVL